MDDGVEEGGARWIGPRMDVAEGAATMDALGDRSAMASAAVLLWQDGGGLGRGQRGSAEIGA